jgi:hypothetical protein
MALRDYVEPVNPSADADGRDLAGRNWSRARKVEAGRLHDEDIDLVVLRRPAAREFASAYLSLDQFLSQWDEAIEQRCA